MDVTNQDFWRQIFTGEEFRTWFRICSWLCVALWFWLVFSLMRGGYSDLAEIARSPYATARERFDARVKYPGRTLAFLAAAAFGAVSFAMGLFVQGAFVILVWRQATGG